jgi:hypothetical protein
VLHLDHLKQDCEYSLTVGVVELASFATTGYPDVFIACRSMAFDGPSREFRTFSIDKGRITPRCFARPHRCARSPQRYHAHCSGTSSTSRISVARRGVAQSVIYRKSCSQQLVLVASVVPSRQ